MEYHLKVRWGTSRGRDTYGYTTCSLTVDGSRVAACNGGGYDMRGTVIGHWIAFQFRDRLLRLRKAYYGLSFHDPNFNPGKAKVPGIQQTVEEREKAGMSLGLERYQAFHSASNPLPTKRHVIPRLDGACGVQSMVAVLEAIGGRLVKVAGTADLDFYTVTLTERGKRKP